MKPKALMDLFGIKIDLWFLDFNNLNPQYKVLLDTYFVYILALAGIVSFFLFAMIALLIGKVS